MNTFVVCMHNIFLFGNVGDL